MNRRVLVAEADPPTRVMIERALSNAGFAPSSVSTVEEAATILDRTPVEVALVDLRATQGDGVEAVTTLRRDHPNLPLVVSATLLTSRGLQDLLRVDVDDVLPKQFTPTELVERVNRAHQRARSRESGAIEYAASIAAARRAIV